MYHSSHFLDFKFWFLSILLKSEREIYWKRIEKIIKKDKEKRKLAKKTFEACDRDLVHANAKESYHLRLP